MIYHSIIIDENLNVWVCGINNYGQLGLGDYKERNILTKIENLPPVIVAARGYVWITGHLDKEHRSNVPIKIKDVKNIVKIACGDRHCILLDQEGNVFSFGSNYYGQWSIENIPKIKDICCGSCHSMLLDLDGNVFAFGSNDFGQLGLGDQINRFIPKKIENLPPIKSFSTGGYHSIFIDINNNVYCCGNNVFNQLGFDDPKDKLIPTKLSLTKDIEIKSVYCGSYSTFLQDIENNLWVFGHNFPGQLGLGHNNKVTTPTKLIFTDEINFVSCSGFSTIIINLKGECFSFGGNSYGQLGLGHTNNVNEPTKIESLKVPARTLDNSRFNKTKNARNCQS